MRLKRRIRIDSIRRKKAKSSKKWERRHEEESSDNSSSAEESEEDNQPMNIEEEGADLRFADEYLEKVRDDVKA